MLNPIAKAALLGLSFAAGLAACDDEPAGPSRDEVAGAYEADVFFFVAGLDTTDLLAEGSSIDIVLDADGTMAGEVVVIGAAADSSDFVADLDGTWRLDGTLIRFVENADTFLGDMLFFYEDDRIRGEASAASLVVVQFARVGTP